MLRVLVISLALVASPKPIARRQSSKGRHAQFEVDQNASTQPAAERRAELQAKLAAIEVELRNLDIDDDTDDADADVSDGKHEQTNQIGIHNIQHLKSASNSSGNEPKHCKGGVRHGRSCCRKGCKDSQCGGDGCYANSGVTDGQSKSCCVGEIESNGMTCEKQDDWGCMLPLYLSNRAKIVSSSAASFGVDTTTYCQRETFVKLNENTGKFWTPDGTTHLCQSQGEFVEWSKYQCSAINVRGDHVVFKCGGYYKESINAVQHCKKNSPCKAAQKAA